MSIWFLALVVWLSSFLLIAGAQDKMCSIVPANSWAIVGHTHEVTCLAKPGTLIISWKASFDPTSDNYTLISSLGVIGIAGSLTKMPPQGYEATYYSLRKSTLEITKVTVDQAGTFFCLVASILWRGTYLCESKLAVFVNQPVFDSTGINLADGIVTNLTCAVTFKGSGILHMKILDEFNVNPRNETKKNFSEFGLHNFHLTYSQKVNITMEAGQNRVSPDLDVQSAFSCTTMPEDSTGYQLTVKCEVDAPVTRVSIVPYSANKCSERICYMHEKLVCLSDGKPRPDKFQWRLALGHEELLAMLDQTPEQNVLISGRNTFECRVFNAIGSYNFTAAGRFTTHVQAYKYILDKYAVYDSKGSKHKVYCLMTILLAFVGFVWGFRPCCRHHYYDG